jgi:hypothetical protein
MNVPWQHDYVAGGLENLETWTVVQTGFASSAAKTLLPQLRCDETIN